jgi:type VI secretion system protein ImpF
MGGRAVRVRTETLVTQTILDRFLLSPEDWPKTRKESMDRYKDAMRRDLEWLLNTRKPVMPILEEFPQVTNSVFNFGFPDLHNFDNAQGHDKDAVSLALEKCIRIFEPRISQPRVSLTRSDTLARSLKFRIEGKIRYDDAEEDIKFDTVLELISGEYEVS